ncbi:MAG: chemotaxis response regulator protein-glutamate methylesterase [endosymbiont of Galathealinum brachiosum]|uniref:Protein-glutamate methylesterase/protein-glutamine glutaminase n=1 Tax=endosymbiont of Galathealinum brachiosum TaxID=2200906 RepID=A0A370D8B9_9GAMM|nr:MAG: chemotaxis response regulator protein-glutamate methylesterase [endosymbiont of Galathealinum brachiosum]
MAIRVLIVDDSGFFRRRLTEILNSDPQIEVVETAQDGKDAIDKARTCRPDVITMDIEMPVMNGIDATREIMKQRAVPIIMFSSLTYDGAKATLDALEAGATDFLPKRFDDISNDKAEARNILCSRVKALVSPSKLRPTSSSASAPASSRTSSAPAAPQRQPVAPRAASPSRRTSNKAFKPSDYDLVAIGTSTGGPVALQEVLTQLPASFPLPVLLVQHMPATFTEAFAARLNQQCKIEVREAKNGDSLKPGIALLAPGGKQMKLEKRAGRLLVRVEEETDPMQNYKPCVDVTFATVGSAVGNRMLGIILTGMGADGSVSCKALQARGASIWAQDEATSVIYGMPAAVAGIAEQILPMKEIGKKLATNT